MQVLKRLKSLFSCQSGNVMAIAAASMPLLIGAAAIGVDTIQVTLAKRELQRAADASALAGAYALVQGKTAADAVDKDLALNNRVPLSATRVVQNAPATGSYSGNARAVRVVLTASRSTPFMGFFNRSTQTVSAEATAAWVYNGKFCMIAKEAGNATGITFSGSTTVNLGCGVATNATSASAIVAAGNAVVTASPVAAVGNVPSSTGYAAGTVLLPYSPVQTDPFAGLANPAPPTGCDSGTYSVNPNQTAPTPATTSTNVICYTSYDIKGTVDFGSDKTIYVAGGSLALGSQANVTCVHCTFVFTGPIGTTAAQLTASPIATLSMHGNAVVNISAANSGTYSGLLMYQDPRATAGNQVYINGNSASTFVGGFYFPSADITFNGNTGMHTECIQLIARRLTFTGNSSITNVCPADATASAIDAIFVKLVG